MANDIFANGREVACKAGSGKSIAAFPDVCMTPPENPATPPGVPVPYPNTGMASDMTSGSKAVKISKKEVMLKNKSYFKKSTGDEAGCAAKKGVVTSTNRGKVYFTMWSMDVKVEGANVVRHLDMTTHNHMSTPGNSIPWLYSDTMDVSKIPKGCEEQANNFNEACGDCVKTHSDGSINNAGTNKAMCDKPECKEARTCILTPKNMRCCDKKTPHHVVPDAQFRTPGRPGTPLLTNANGTNKYSYGNAPCVCLTGHSNHNGDHGKTHRITNRKTKSAIGVPSDESIPTDKRWDVGQSEAVGAEAVEESTGGECKKECTQAQLRQGHQNMGIAPSDQVRPTTAGKHIEKSDNGGLI